MFRMGETAAFLFPEEVFPSNCRTSHVSRKHSDFERKTLKSKKDYRDNPTSFEKFLTEI